MYWFDNTLLIFAFQSLDQLLSEKVCKSLVERLSSQYLGQIVQILINLEHFETACQELEQLLVAARSSTSAGGPIILIATEEFRSNKKTAEKRIFELVNSKIDDLVETAEYDWYVRTCMIMRSAWLIRSLQDGANFRNRAKQLYANADQISFKHYEFDATRSTSGD